MVFYSECREMSQIKTADKKIEELTENNKELVKSVEFWKRLHRKVEDEKFNLQKENNELILKNREFKNKIRESHSFLKNLMCQSFELYTNISSKFEQIDRTLNECETLYDLSIRDSNYGNGNSPPSNVHHVQPMIRGVPLKTPILKVPRANINCLNGRVQTSNININNSTENVENNTTRQNCRVQNVSVCLQRLDGDAIRRAIFGDRTDMETEDSNVQSSTNINSIQDSYVLISRIDNVNVRRSDTQDNVSPINSNEENKNNSTNSSNVPLRDGNENSYTSDNESMEDMQYTNCDYDPYNSPLECIVEETEVSVAKTLEQKSPGNSTSSSLKRWSSLSNNNNSSNEDPLEGPSWKIHNSSEAEQNSKDFEDDTLLNNINQMSDSINDNEDADVNCISTTPKFTSTPNVKICNIFIDDRLSSNKENLRCSSENTSKDTNNKKTQNVEKKKTKSKGVGKKSIRKSTSKSKIAKTKSSKTRSSSINKRSKSTDSVPSSQTSLTDNDSLNSIRPRRVNAVNYKEKSLNTKLRRE